MKRVKITEDGFVWHVLTEAEAKQALGKVEAVSYTHLTLPTILRV